VKLWFVFPSASDESVVNLLIVLWRYLQHIIDDDSNQALSTEPPLLTVIRVIHRLLFLIERYAAAWRLVCLLLKSLCMNTNRRIRGSCHGPAVTAHDQTATV
jgi:hypothetical protein